jgi:hypothetical protein
VGGLSRTTTIVLPAALELIDLSTLTFEFPLLASEAFVLILGPLMLRVSLRSDHCSPKGPGSRAYRDAGPGIARLIAYDRANARAKRGTSDRSRHGIVSAVFLFAASGKRREKGEAYDR